MSEKPSEHGTAFVQVFSGMGMGLLVGIIVGLSVSEVVSIILGALAALLAAFLGLQDSQTAKQAEGGDPAAALRRARMTGLRAGSFGIACVAAILLGIFLRTHGVLSGEEKSLKEQVAVWQEAGYDKKDALMYVAYQNLKILPKSVEVRKAADSGGAENTRLRASMGVLFSGEGTLNYCHDLSLKTNGSVENTLAAYRATQNGQLIALADKIRDQVPPEAQTYVLQAVDDIICKLQEGTNNIELYVPEEHQEALKLALKEALCNL